MDEIYKIYLHGIMVHGQQHFESRDEYFLFSLFKEPGKYNFNEASLVFNADREKI
jgi:hypothetical protein